MASEVKTEKQALSFINSLESRGIKLGLERIKSLLDELKRPEKNYKIIHIAGTNGKGSVSTMIASVLKTQGYKTGLYLSPHIEKFNERIQINNKKISEKQLIKQTNKLKKICEKNKIEISHFEFITALALNFFFEQKCDFVVLETGMGGRLDATNVVNSKFQVITNISLEHEKNLGTTLNKIAKEKAGIIKQNSILVCGEKRKVLQKIFAEKAKSKKTKALFIEKDFNIKKFKLSLRGKHQQENATVALEMLNQISLNGNKISKKSILNGLKKAFIPARLEFVRKKPIVLIDSAHNVSGIKTLVSFLQENFPEKKFNIIFGVSEPRKPEELFLPLKKFAKKVFCTQAKYKGLSAKSVKTAINNVVSNIETEKISSVKLAVKKAFNESKKTKTPLIITGSLYLCAEARKEFQ